jgi:hypothetical protein
MAKSFRGRVEEWQEKKKESKRRSTGTLANFELVLSAKNGSVGIHATNLDVIVQNCIRIYYRATATNIDIHIAWHHGWFDWSVLMSAERRKFKLRASRHHPASIERVE